MNGDSKFPLNSHSIPLIGPFLIAIVLDVFKRGNFCTRHVERTPNLIFQVTVQADVVWETKL
jgi:hypothetical protein